MSLLWVTASRRTYTPDEVADENNDFAGNDEVHRLVAEHLGKDPEDLHYTHERLPLTAFYPHLPVEDWGPPGSHDREYVESVGKGVAAGRTPRIVVTKNSPGQHPYDYTIHDGHHRVAGARNEGLTHIDAFVGH